MLLMSHGQHQASAFLSQRCLAQESKQLAKPAPALYRARPDCL